MKKLILISSLLVLAGSLFAQKKQAIKKGDDSKNPVAEKGKGNAQFDYTSFDFGTLNEKGGKVHHEFKFTNVGTSPLRVVNVITSCGCTSTNWIKTEIAPGEKGFVKASFDSDQRQGKFDKTITVQFEGGSPTYQSLTISGHVYPSRYDFSDTYRYQYGNLAVKTNSINFDAVKNTSFDSAEIGFYNMSNKTIYVYRVDAPYNMFITKPYDYMIPGTDLTMKLIYFPAKPLQYGPIRQEIKVYTNDDSLPVKIFYVNAKIVEDFGVLDKKALKKAPKAKFDKTQVDLGQIHLFDSPTATFKITNKGKDDLIIRRVLRTCSCLVPELSGTIIPKGETAILKVNYSLANMAGPESKTLILITNDPKQSEVTLTVTIDVIP